MININLWRCLFSFWLLFALGADIVHNLIPLRCHSCNHFRFLYDLCYMLKEKVLSHVLHSPIQFIIWMFYFIKFLIHYHINSIWCSMIIIIIFVYFYVRLMCSGITTAFFSRRLIFSYSRITNCFSFEEICLRHFKSSNNSTAIEYSSIVWPSNREKKFKKNEEFFRRIFFIVGCQRIPI